MFQFSYLPERYLVPMKPASRPFYPGKTSALGTLSGKVVAADGSAVQAALVTAIDTNAGTALSAFTAPGRNLASVQAPADSYVIYADAMTGTALG